MKPDNWTQQLHDKLAEHETAAPEGLWADIEAALDNAPAAPTDMQKPHSTRFMAMRRWAVAASVAILLLGGGFIWWNVFMQPRAETKLAWAMPRPRKGRMKSNLFVKPNEQSEARFDSAMARKGRMKFNLSNKPLAEKNPPYTAMVTEKKTPDYNEPLTKEPSDNAPHHTAKATDGSGVSTDKVTEIASADNGSGVSTDKVTEIAELDDNKTIETELKEKGKPEYDERRMADGMKSGLPEGWKFNDTPVKREGKQPAISLYAMNSFSQHTTNSPVQMSEAMARHFSSFFDNSNAAPASSSETFYLAGYEEHKHHRLPVSYGLTLSYPLSRQMAVLTGVTFTKLSSDFTQVIRHQRIEQHQTLRYVGVPVGLSYRLLRYKAFSAYATVGAKALWNVSARLSTEGVTQHLHKDRLQWSLDGGLGLQLEVMPHLALYAEPALSFYPDNGSKIQNYFKDKPTSLGLQVGLRLDIEH